MQEQCALPRILKRNFYGACSISGCRRLTKYRRPRTTFMERWWEGNDRAEMFTPSSKSFFIMWSEEPVLQATFCFFIMVSKSSLCLYRSSVDSKFNLSFSCLYCYLFPLAPYCVYVNMFTVAWKGEDVYKKRDKTRSMRWYVFFPSNLRCCFRRYWGGYKQTFSLFLTENLSYMSLKGCIKKSIKLSYNCNWRKRFLLFTTSETRRLQIINRVLVFFLFS